MDTRDGKIFPSLVDALKHRPNSREYLKQMEIPLMDHQLRKGKVGVNDPCPCGSGHKFKKCCMK